MSWWLICIPAAGSWGVKTCPKSLTLECDLEHDWNCMDLSFWEIGKQAWTSGLQKFQEVLGIRAAIVASHSLSILPLTLDPLSCHCVCCTTLPPLTSSQLSGYFIIYGWGVHNSDKFSLSYFYLFKNFIFSHASRSPGIYSLGAVLPTHYTLLPPHYAQAVHPISLFIIWKHSFLPPSKTLLCLNITHCRGHQSQQWALPLLTEHCPSHCFGC